MSDHPNVANIVNNLLDENPALQQIKIRVDKKTQKASALDVIRMVTGKDGKRASEYFSRLSAEVTEKCGQLRIGGKGRLTWVADAPTLVEIIWELPGKAAKAFRRASAHYICRMLGGDLSLAHQIEETYKKASPESKRFFLAHADKPVLDEEAQRKILKRKAELDLEEYERKMRMRLGKMEAEAKQFEAKAKLAIKQNHVQTLKLDMECVQMRKDTLEDIKKSNIDDNDLVWLQDIVRESGRYATDDGSSSSNNPRREISIPLICQRMNVHPRGLEGKIGRLVVRLWRKKHNKGPRDKPPKRVSMFNGRAIQINHYTEDDADIVKAAIMTVMNAEAEKDSNE